MSKPMTKTQLVATLADKMSTDKKSAAASLDAICDLITSEVSGGWCCNVARCRKNLLP